MTTRISVRGWTAEQVVQELLRRFDQVAADGLRQMRTGLILEGFDADGLDEVTERAERTNAAARHEFEATMREFLVENP